MRFLFLIFGIVVFSCNHAMSQSSVLIEPKKPKLIVGIVIDQMKQEYLFRFRDKFGTDGFRKIIVNGAMCKDTRVNYYFNGTEAGYASIATGTYPAYHGIASSQWYNNLSGKTMHCTKNNQYNTIGGSFESGKHAPAQLLTTTIGDELAMANQKHSKIFSVSLDPSSAVLSAGHIANAAYSFDDATGNWITSSFYADSLPSWIRTFNQNKIPDAYIQQTWTTMLPIEQYIESTEDNAPWETGFNGKSTFPYDLRMLSGSLPVSQRYSLLRSTPMGNNLTKDFAISLIVNEQLGKDNYTDYLLIGLSATQYIEKNFGSRSVELEDAYLRLDRDLAHLVKFIEDSLGKDNVLFFITSPSTISYDAKYMQAQKIPVSYFNCGSSVSLLKMYLNVTYGKAEWIKLYNDQQIYLNRTLIEDSKMSLNDMQDKAARFMLQFDGIMTAVPAHTLLNNSFSEGLLLKMQNGYNLKHSGDVIIALKPGWTEKPVTSSSPAYSYDYISQVPLIWYGCNIKPQVVTRTTDITDIAPTLSYMLNIPFTNGCVGKPIIELGK